MTLQKEEEKLTNQDRIEEATARVNILIDEHKLILQKKSDLSAKKRNVVVNMLKQAHAFGKLTLLDDGSYEIKEIK